MSDVTSSASEALDNLVNQFSDRLAFFRELIQNAVDAGSAEIDVWFEFQPPDDGGDIGVMLINVDDYGEGMDRQIIDTKLTRLFSSAKDGDLTKIGKFGIGFVSVFAIQPQAVCVDTSRAGENWRVLFQEDRSFMRIERDYPVEGTKIQIIKSVTEAEFDDFEQRSYETILHWCKHLGAEIRFQGEPVNQAFDLELPVKVRHEEKGTEIVVGYCAPDATFYGFYNKGLTLHEGTDLSSYGMPGVAYKVSSRYLEHTLTRDRIIEDNNYKKAMRIVEELIEGPLVERLFELHEAAMRDEGGELKGLRRRVCAYLRGGEKLPKGARGRGLLMGVDGKPVSYDVLSRAARRGDVLLAHGASALTRDLQAQEDKVVVRSAPGVAKVLRALGVGQAAFARDLYARPMEVTDEDVLARWTPLRDALARLLDAQGAKVSGVHLGRFDEAGSGIASWPALSQGEAWEVTKRTEGRAFGSSLFSRKRALVVNAALPVVETLMAVAEKEPEYAAYTLIKLFYLGHSLEPKLDAELTEHVAEQRLRRVRSA